MASKRPKVEQNDSPFTEGSIVRIKLENFLTYDSVEFRPGPSLNVIIGPNGTGKSTIVCGICLGLAGKPNLLGRANSAMDYIKHNCNRAVIEIELFNPFGDNYVIHREINKDNTSKWSVNGRNASARNVEVAVAKLNIQVGNLCQFLPQDKVADFAKMTSQELLESTEKAVGSPEMFQHHVDLKSAREKARELELSLTRVQEQLEQEQQLNSRLEQDVKNYRERKKHLEKIDQLKEKRRLVEYEDKRQQHDAAKVMKQSLADQVRKARLENAPMQRKIEQASKNLKDVDAKMRKLGDAVKEQAKLATDAHTTLEATNDQVQTLQDEFEAKRQDEANRKKKMRDMLGQIQSLETELANTPDDDVQPRTDALNQEMADLSRQITHSQQTAETAKMRTNNLKREIAVLQTELKDIQDVGNRRLEELRRRHRDTYNAILWLRANHHIFSGVIHEPMRLIINMKDSAHAKYIESTISFNDMQAFVCENVADMKLFMDHVRNEQSLRVNVVVAPNEPADSFQPPQPIEKLRQYGFKGYLRDLFECPELVMRYLCKNYHVHRIPVGDARTKANVETIIAQNQQLSNFYTDNHKYTIRKSKYSNAFSSRCMELRPPTILVTTFNGAKERELKLQIDKKQEEMKKLENEWREIDKAQKGWEKQMEVLRNQKKELMNAKNQRRNILQKIGMKKDTLKRLESEAVNIEKEETTMKQKVSKILQQKCELLVQLQDFTMNCLRLREDKVRQSLVYTSTQYEVQQLEEQQREQSYSLRNLEQEFEKKKAEVTELKDLALKLFNALKKHSNIDNIDNMKPDFSRELRMDITCGDQGEVFDMLPSTLEQIDAALHEEQARADCTFQTDHSVVEDYKQREKRITSLQSEVVRREQELIAHQSNIEETKKKWLSPLQDLVRRINKNFAYFFHCMKCAGEIDLSIPENPEDYEKYGIRIKVLFRSSEQLRELTPHHQSGGERSVATVLYMMALQELTRVPFRCVDEINQGMDPQNERKVFELIVQTACENSTSQYFLLTPKLLPDLHYTDNMTILCVQNGPYMINHTEWKLSKFIRRGQKLD